VRNRYYSVRISVNPAYKIPQEYSGEDKCYINS
jgi:hypothetical protein